MRYALVTAMMAATFGFALSPSADAAHNRWCDYPNLKTHHFADSQIYWANESAVDDSHSVWEEEARTDSNSWANYTDVGFTARNPGDWRIDDEIVAMADRYGDTGWHGYWLMTKYDISPSCIIHRGEIRLNYSVGYLRDATKTSKKHVACQEIGNILGLNDRSNASASCMNYSFNHPYPDTHDQTVINSIY